MLDALRNHTPTPATGVPVIVDPAVAHPLPTPGRHRVEVVGPHGWTPKIPDRPRRFRRSA